MMRMELPSVVSFGVHRQRSLPAKVGDLGPRANEVPESATFAPAWQVSSST
jgi:hypothetical protein